MCALNISQVLAISFVVVAILSSFVPAVALFTYFRLKSNLALNTESDDRQTCVNYSMLLRVLGTFMYKGGAIVNMN